MNYRITYWTKTNIQTILADSLFEVSLIREALKAVHRIHLTKIEKVLDLTNPK